LIATLLAALLAEPASIILRLHLSRGQPALSLPISPPARDLAEARQQDVADLRLLPSYDRSFSPYALRRWRHGIDELDEIAGTLPPAGFEMAVSRLVALAGNAHTTVNKAQRVRDFGRVPVRFGWFSGELYVVRATARASRYWAAVSSRSTAGRSRRCSPTWGALSAALPNVRATTARR